MASDTPPTDWFAGVGAGAWRYRPRQLWQVPVFFLGVLALVGVCLARPLWRDPEAHSLERDLEVARRLVEQQECPLDRLQACLAGPLEEGEHSPLHAGEAHFLLGTAHLRLAESATGDAANEHRQQARFHLEQAQTLGVPEECSSRLRYRLGKVWYECHEEPQRVLDELVQAVPAGADDPVEAYALLTQLYLHLPQPDFQAALDANQKELDAPTVDERILAPARLLRGELLLRVGKPEEAREVMKFIKPPAPPALVARARLLLARSYQDDDQDEDHWSKAALMWKQLLGQSGDAGPDAGQYLYHLGVCEAHLDHSQEARQAWEKAMARDHGEAGLASALGLAELRLRDRDPEVAVSVFERIAREAPQVAGHNDGLVDMNQIRNAFERGCVIYHATARYELAMRLAGLYEKLAPPGVAESYFAQSAEAAGRSRLEQVRQAKEPQAGGPSEEGARNLLRQAASKYLAAVTAAPGADQGERLWRAASCSVEGEDYTTAVSILQRWLKVGQPAERLGEAWFLLGECRHGLHQEKEALEAYAECMRQPGTFAWRARYETALLNVARGETDQAAANLERIVNEDTDGPVREKALFALASLEFRRHNYDPAMLHLERALQLYPTSTRAAMARYQLAECYRNQADQAGQNLRLPERMLRQTEQHFVGQLQGSMEKARQTYAQLAHDLLGRMPLSEEDELLFRLAAFAAAECSSNLGHYDEAISLYQPLATRYEHRVEQLYALAGIASCCHRKRDSQAARKVLEQIRGLLHEMKDGAFDSPFGHMTRQEWEKWLEQVSKLD